jgi:hypothetical protein
MRHIDGLPLHETLKTGDKGMERHSLEAFGFRDDAWAKAPRDIFATRSTAEFGYRPSQAASHGLAFQSAVQNACCH